MQTKADQFDAETAAMAEQAKALSHPARLAILRVLAERSECICGEIVEDLPLAQSTVSRHLKVLKEAGLIRGTVDGPSVCYCLDPEAITTLGEQFGAFFDELSDAAEEISC
ncbi:MAG: transcriptional regulator [Bacteroidetes bacterium SW_9_63_38]|nr:MAG: transcriptional regulator [Bacteroidetes bacterium SW_9_63_38]